MRILFVTSRSPLFPTRGDALRAYHQIRVLSRRHEITLVSPRYGGGVRVGEGPLGPSQVVDLRWSRLGGLRELLKAPFSALPIQVLYLYPPHSDRMVGRLVSTQRFDVVHVQLARMGPMVDAVETPCILDFQDAFSLNAERRARLRSGPWSWAMRFEAARMRRYERELVEKVAFCTVASAADRHALGDPPNCVVIPNGVDLGRFRFRPGRGASHDIILSGSMRYDPNADAAEWFATRILPRVQTVVPGARFLIVGADPPRRVRRLGALSGVNVTGYVPNMPERISGAAVSVAPLRCATGIQNKVLEAMAVGTPVVATPDAVQGIEATSGHHLLMGRSEEELAAHVQHLLLDRTFADTMGHEARRLVELQYTWEHVVGVLEHTYAAAASTGGLSPNLAAALAPA